MHIYYAFNANNLPYMFERMPINKRKAQGDLILKHIKAGFTEDYIIPFQHSFWNLTWNKGTFS